MTLSNWYTSRWAIILFHVLTWVLTLFLPYLIRPVIDANPGFRRAGYFRNEQFRPVPPGDLSKPGHGSFQPIDSTADQFPKAMGNRPDGSFFTYMAMSLNLVWIGLFYLNAYLLIPRLIYQRKLLAYIGIQLLFLFSIAFIAGYYINWKTNSPAFRFPMPILLNTFPFFFVQASSIAFRLIVDKIKVDKLLKEKETVGLQTELSFLRSQISPHFIFNVLNNMVSLARKKSDQLETSLLRLSGLMRYMLYESDETKVLLTKEIEYLQSYIELQQLRFGDDIRINVDMKAPDLNYFIEPMLLIPFVENAFKHCSMLHHDALIEINMQAQKGVLNLQVRNNYDADHMLNNDNTSGIGLANVKRRLNLLYENKHSLMISESNGMYIVSLQMQFT